MAFPGRQPYRTQGYLTFFRPANVRRSTFQTWFLASRPRLTAFDYMQYWDWPPAIRKVCKKINADKIQAGFLEPKHCDRISMLAPTSKHQHGCWASCRRCVNMQHSGRISVEANCELHVDSFNMAFMVSVIVVDPTIWNLMSLWYSATS